MLDAALNVLVLLSKGLSIFAIAVFLLAIFGTTLALLIDPVRNPSPSRSELYLVEETDNDIR